VITAAEEFHGAKYDSKKPGFTELVILLHRPPQTMFRLNTAICCPGLSGQCINLHGISVSGQYWLDKLDCLKPGGILERS
jgi:hypothetical protein